LGACVHVLGVVGDDELGRRLVGDLEGRGADVSGVVRDASRPTTHKMRILAGRQQLLRVDTEEVAPLAGGLGAQLRDRLRSALREADVALVSDYAKGVVLEVSLPGDLIAGAREAGVPVCADPKPENMELFRGAHLVSPNEAEALRAVGAASYGPAAADSGSPRPDQDAARPSGLAEAVFRAGLVLRERMDAAAVFVTRGDRGIAVFPREAPVTVVPARSFSAASAAGGTEATEVGDGTGCGDAASAASALAIAVGADFREAAELANAAGGVVSRFVGVYSPRRAEMLAALGADG
jgi:D-beta-D-heptose 7-phosphate kinase/D-beta-D-heptose 1-phosphate adenosyltransferase